jgi:hypothetical protein
MPTCEVGSVWVEQISQSASIVKNGRNIECKVRIIRVSHVSVHALPLHQPG